MYAERAETASPPILIPTRQKHGEKNSSSQRTLSLYFPLFFFNIAGVCTHFQHNVYFTEFSFRLRYIDRQSAKIESIELKELAISRDNHIRIR